MQRFVKYHGLGNDFLVLSRLEGGAVLSAEQVRRLCDRHLGVGGDGVLSVWPDREGKARMQVQNADGSDSEMCGNGLRCVARYLYDEGVVNAGERSIKVRAGAQLYAVERVEAGRFRVTMGAPLASHADLPSASGGTVRLAAHGRDFVATPLHFGNPHAVIFVDEAPLPLAERFGAALEAHAAFPRRVNVSFARQVGRGFSAVVYERGVGITQACGSGAAAIGAAAVLRGLWPSGRAAAIELPGGELLVTVDAGGAVQMEGEAVRVFAGEVAA